MPSTSGAERIIDRLEKRVRLSDQDRQAIRALPAISKTIDPSTYLVREGEAADTCIFLLSGFAYRHKVTGEGCRQILSVHMPGEFLDLQNSLLGIADHNVQALTRCEVASVPASALRRLAQDHPTVGRAMWIDTLVDSAIFREWIVNLGRRDSITRISHLLCELVLRMSRVGLGRRNFCELPLTQEQLADCTGLTPVHVNRVLKELNRRGLIERHKRSVTIADWDELSEVGDFNTRYLHFVDAGPDRLASVA